MLETYIGGMAAAVGICISLPQIWKTHNSKRADDLSRPMWVLLAIGQSLWLTYGLLRGDNILALANVVALIQSFTILGMIHIYKK